MTYHPFSVQNPAATVEKRTGVENPHTPKNNSGSFSLLCPLLIFCDVLMQNLFNQSHETCNYHLVLDFTIQHLVDFSYSRCI